MSPVHWHALRAGMLFAGAACGAPRGDSSEEPGAITCPYCLRIWRDAHTAPLPGFTVAPAAARPVSEEIPAGLRRALFVRKGGR